MISWTISIEPVWSSTASSNDYRSGGLFKQDFQQGGIDVPAISSALGVVKNDSTLITENWSQTISHKYSGPDPQGDFSLNATTVRGTTNSSVESVAYNSNNLITGITRNVTILATQASQTSTTKTTQWTRTSTTTSTQNYNAFSTTSLTNNNSETYRTITNITSQTRTFKRTTSETLTLQTEATTTIGSHLNNVYAATVYKAQTRYASGANVIWVADQSVVSEGIAAGAASDFATSTTLTTIYPVFETTEFSVFNKDTTSSFGHTNAPISQDLQFITTDNINAVETRVLYNFAIPQITATENGTTRISQNSSTSNTVFTSNSFSAFATKEATQTGISRTKISDTKFGLPCDRTFFETITRTIVSVDSLWTTSGSTTSTVPAPTAVWKTSSAASDTVIIVGNPISESTQQNRGITTVITPSWQATTRSALPASIQIEAVSGVRTPNNSIAGYYEANGITCFADDAFVFASRNVQTAMPRTFVIFTNNADLEEPDLSKIGTASFSSLSGTATTTGLNGTETTTSSFTFSLQPQGVGTTFRGSSISNIVSCGGKLGISETAFVTIPAGVYKGLDGSTVSKTEEVASYTSGNGLKYSDGISFFQTTQTQSISKIVWTSLRNSTVLP